MLYYLLPPVAPAPLAGDLYHGAIDEQAGYWILITPSCDMVPGRERRADFMLFARCLHLTEAIRICRLESRTPGNHPTM